MDSLEKNLKVMVVVAGVGNLSQTVLWLGVLFIIRNTSLKLLKLLAAMMSAMNLAWFIASWFLNEAAENATSLEEALATKSYTIFNWGACSYAVLFGLSHWMFVMSYFTLALRAKYPDKFGDFSAWLNRVYYAVGALNVLLPILQAGLNKFSFKISGIFMVAVTLLWILSSVVMILSLVFLKRSFDAQSRVLANIKEMLLHATVFVIFALNCTIMAIFYCVLGHDKSIATAVTVV